MPPARLSALILLVIAAAAVTIAVGYGLRGAIGWQGGLALTAVALVALRLALGRGR